MKKPPHLIAASALSASLAAVADTAPNQHTAAYIEGMGGTNLYAPGLASCENHVTTGGLTYHF